MSSNNKFRKTFYIQGMHCNACEMLIKQDVSGIAGVNDVVISMSESSAIVTANSKREMPTLTELNEMFNDSGYKFFESKNSISKLSKRDFYIAFGLALLFILLFLSLDSVGISNGMALGGEGAFFSYFIFGLAAGISSCAALVGGLLLSLSEKWNKVYANNSQKSLLPFILFNSSRLASFAIFGFILGLIGSVLSISIGFSSFIAILVSILMLGIGLQMLGVKGFRTLSFNKIVKSSYLDKNQDFHGKYIPIIVGAMTFFVPCGFTMIAQTTVLTSGSPISGAINLFAFALGTLPILAVISFSSIKIYSHPKFSKQFNIFSGVLIVFFAIYSFNSQLNVLGLKSLNDLTISKNKESTNILNTARNKADIQVDDGAEQFIQMEASGFDYYPKQFVIRSGLKTRWEIYENKAVGCAKAVYARGLYKDIIYLKPGMNSVTFIAPAPGTYKVSCSMGMVDPIYVKVI